MTEFLGKGSLVVTQDRPGKSRPWSVVSTTAPQPFGLEVSMSEIYVDIVIHTVLEDSELPCSAIFHTSVQYSHRRQGGFFGTNNNQIFLIGSLLQQGC